ncbi:MAG: hypothetical protein OEY97_13835 [Nitrospirota bacterium]|nr:hypothetical protein [Nitrospirota bacterium]
MHPVSQPSTPPNASRCRLLPHVIAVVCLMVLLAAPNAPASASDIAVVVHPDSPMTQVSVTELRDIYLGEMTFWSGARLVPVTFQNQSPIQATFLQQVLGISGNAYKTYWIKRIFREGGIPPLRVSSVEEMMHLVAHTPGAIGFVPAELASGTSSVRQILQIPDK